MPITVTTDNIIDSYATVCHTSYTYSLSLVSRTVEGYLASGETKNSILGIDFSYNNIARVLIDVIDRCMGNQ